MIGAARPARSSRRATVLAVVLLVGALTQAYWATGATWPARDHVSLSLAVLGVDLPFSPAVLLSSVAVMSAAAVVVFARGRLGRDCRLGGLLQVGTLTVTSGLLTRALIGLLWCLPTIADTRQVFYWLNLAAYTPACAALGVVGWGLLTEGGAPQRRTGVTGSVSARGVAGVVPVVIVAALLGGAYAYTPSAQRGYKPEAALGSVESRYVQTPVARFHYIRQGSGSPVVLLSPGSAWLAAWLPQFRALSATHTVYAVDLPGQGFTELTERGFRFDLSGMTGAIGSFLDALHLPRVILAGNSWSGGWALAYAQPHPPRVSTLVLLAPSGLDQPDPLSWEILKLPVLGRALTNLSVSSRSIVAASVRGVFVHKDLVTAAMVEGMWAPNTLPDNVRATYELEAGLNWRTTQNALPETGQRTLIIWGRQDTVLPVRQAATFAAIMPNARAAVLDGCGHALTLDCPDQVNALMTGFLRGR